MVRITALAVASVFYSPLAVMAEDAPQAAQSLQPFAEFLAGIASSQSGAAASATPAVASARSAPTQAQSYLASLYAGVDAKAVKHSFVDANDTAFDCIPIMQQPALHGSTEPLPTPPDIPKSLLRAASADGQTRASNVSAAETDRFGNAMACADGAIPMARVTPEQIGRFASLQDFFRKSPDGAGGLPRRAASSSSAVQATHRYAHAYQEISNVGGHSFLNLWKPPVAASQIFSLSQHWYVGGNGSRLQTAETGWQVYPKFYKTAKPVFFIYWTSDGYTTKGCYNLTCAAFVQTSNTFAIGGALKPWSTSPKKQVALELMYFLYQGKWWLYVNGTAAANAIGYYPASLYNGGAMSIAAEEIDYGGETVGTKSWPAMGSGKFASLGFGKAAYQSDIFYIPASGPSVSANLTVSQDWPWAYTASFSYLNSPNFSTLFFGGPGGKR
ncbi:neprosin family prolyl endopeptidase [Methylocella silvestris]|nr:neprosin family prolyl endopeptidase [Methylocella silvestris]